MSITSDSNKLEALSAQLTDMEGRITLRLADRLRARIAAGWSSGSPAAAGEAPASVSGGLASSIGVEAGESGGVRVGTDLAYGRALEYGTSRMAARPWLRPAVEGVRAEVAGLVREMLTSQEGEEDAGTQAGDSGSTHQRGGERGDGDL